MIIEAQEEEQKKKKKSRKSEKLGTKNLLFQGFNLASNFLGEHWKVSEEEAERLANPLDRVLAKYGGVAEKLEKYGDIFELAVVSFAVFAPRVMITLAESKESREKLEQEGTSVANSGSSPAANTRAGNVSGNVKNILAELVQ